jgi:hypothetical protein
MTTNTAFQVDPPGAPKQLTKKDFSVRHAKSGTWYIIAGHRGTLGRNGKVTWFATSEAADRAVDEITGGKGDWQLVPHGKAPAPPVYPDNPITIKNRREAEARSDASHAEQERKRVIRRQEAEQSLSWIRSTLEAETK